MPGTRPETALVSSTISITTDKNKTASFSGNTKISISAKAIYIRLVDMKCPLVVVILIYTHLMQVC